ncbi:MAG: chlorophyll a/b-binding protein [Stanieria sp.]
MQNQASKLGFTRFAEIWNGRLAMLGFAIAVMIELITSRGILAQLGLM